jgi:hypothetical protein
MSLLPDNFLVGATIADWRRLSRLILAGFRGKYAPQAARKKLEAPRAQAYY